MEIKRQLSHLGLGILFLVLIFYDVIGVKTLLVILVVGFFVSLLCLKYKVPFVSCVLDNLERKGNYPGKGALFFVLGSLIVVWIFSKEIALASIAILTVGDSISHLYGRYFGRLKNPLNRRKAVEGSLVGFITGGVAASLFVPLLSAFVASFVAMVLEAVELSVMKISVDDNFLVPVVSGIVLWLMSLI